MTLKNISINHSTNVTVPNKLLHWQGSNLRPPDHQLNTYMTEPQRLVPVILKEKQYRDARWLLAAKLVNHFHLDT